VDILGPGHLIVLLLVALLLFGSQRLPEIGRSIGTGMREFRDAVGGHDHGDRDPAQVAASLTADTDGTQPAACEPRPDGEG
jgi:sec-independent protein translocase protein TatA